MTLLKADFHCHVLPGMDDGAADCDVSRGMLAALKAQGIEQVLATPHFYSHREPLEVFLARRGRSSSALCAAQGGEGALPVRLGAEVRVERGVSGLAGLDRLSWGDRRCLLLELPYAGYKGWMAEEIYNVAFRWAIVPVIAHVERCLNWYSKGEMAEILSIQGAIYQVNTEALLEKKSLRFVLRLVEMGMPVILGSDAHNLTDRAPGFDRTGQLLQDKLKEREIKKLLALGEALLP